jgi:hypothetical protein
MLNLSQRNETAVIPPWEVISLRAVKQLVQPASQDVAHEYLRNISQNIPESAKINNTLSLVDSQNNYLLSIFHCQLDLP